MMGRPCRLPKARKMISKYNGDIDKISDDLKFKFMTGQTLNAPADVKTLPADELGEAPSTVQLPKGMTMKEFMCKKDYFEALAVNDFEFDAQGYKGNPAGGKWQRYIAHKATPQTVKDEYKSLKHRPDLQRAFRADWARKEYMKFQESTTFKKAYKETIYADSRYFNVGKIMAEEGGGLRGMKNAVFYALRCLAMGGPWVKENSFTRDMLWLYKVEGMTEEYSTTWEITKQRFNDVAEAGGRTRAPATAALQ